MSDRALGWDYPAGAEHDLRAPWNEQEESDVDRRQRIDAERMDRAWDKIKDEA
jgi:hypothetical protein